MDESPSHLKEFEEMKDEDDYARFIEFYLFINIFRSFIKIAFQKSLLHITKISLSFSLFNLLIYIFFRQITGLENHIRYVEDWLSRPINDVNEFKFCFKK